MRVNRIDGVADLLASTREQVRVAQERAAAARGAFYERCGVGRLADLIVQCWRLACWTGALAALAWLLGY